MKITYTLKQIIEKVEPFYAEGQKEIDITAVIKYVDGMSDNLEIELSFKKWKILDFRYRKKYWLPSKPLDIYTEEELKNLLQILNNIESND